MNMFIKNCGIVVASLVCCILISCFNSQSLDENIRDEIRVLKMKNDNLLTSVQFLKKKAEVERLNENNYLSDTISLVNKDGRRILVKNLFNKRKVNLFFIYDNNVCDVCVTLGIQEIEKFVENDTLDNFKISIVSNYDRRAQKIAQNSLINTNIEVLSFHSNFKPFSGDLIKNPFFFILMEDNQINMVHIHDMRFLESTKRYLDILNIKNLNKKVNIID